MQNFLILIFFAVFSSLAHASSLKDIVIPDDLKLYAAQYHKVENSPAPQSIEDLYRHGEQAKAAFFELNNDTMISAVVWGDEREEFEKQMANYAPGYTVAQGAEFFYYEANAEDFLQLAKKNGRKADVDFFELYSKHFPRGETWPAYVEQKSDIMGCVKYGRPEFFEYYKDWNDFLEKNKDGYYAVLAKNYLYAFDITSRCSCDSKEETIRSLKSLAKISENISFDKNLGIEIDKRQNTPNASSHPPNDPNEWYKYNGEACGG